VMCSIEEALGRDAVRRPLPDIPTGPRAGGPPETVGRAGCKPIPAFHDARGVARIRAHASATST
jgi:hypothetical protein